MNGKIQEGSTQPGPDSENKHFFLVESLTTTIDFRPRLPVRTGNRAKKSSAQSTVASGWQAKRLTGTYHWLGHFSSKGDGTRAAKLGSQQIRCNRGKLNQP